MTRYNAGATARIGCCHMQTGLLVWRGANLRRALHATQPYAASGRLAGRPPAVCLHQRFTGSASEYDSAFGMRRVYFCNIFSTFYFLLLFFFAFSLCFSYRISATLAAGSRLLGLLFPQLLRAAI